MAESTCWVFGVDGRILGCFKPDLAILAEQFSDPCRTIPSGKEPSVEHAQDAAEALGLSAREAMPSGGESDVRIEPN